MILEHTMRFIQDTIFSYLFPDSDFVIQILHQGINGGNLLWGEWISGRIADEMNTVWQ